MKKPKLHSEIVIYGNRRFLNSMIQIGNWFDENNVRYYLSYIDFKLKIKQDFLDVDEIANLNYHETVKRIRNPISFGVVIFNPDLYEIPNYVEPSVFAAIAVAITQGKKVYLTHGFPELYQDELRGWDCKIINGDLQKIYKEIQEKIIIENSQLRLFD